jgi:hypothetical protein
MGETDRIQQLEAEVARQAARTQALEDERDGKQTGEKKVDVAEWRAQLENQQDRAFLERRARGEAMSAAREVARERTARERRDLESRIAEVRDERAARTAEIDRERARAAAEFGARENEITRELAALGERVEAMAAREVAGKPLKLPRLAPRLPGPDYSGMARTGAQPFTGPRRGGKLRRVLAGGAR